MYALQRRGPEHRIYPALLFNGTTGLLEQPHCFWEGMTMWRGALSDASPFLLSQSAFPKDFLPSHHAIITDPVSARWCSCHATRGGKEGGVEANNKSPCSTANARKDFYGKLFSSQRITRVALESMDRVRIASPALEDRCRRSSK